MIKLLIKAFETLSVNDLELLDDDSSYSYDYKFELIQKLDKLFQNFKSQGIKSLEFKEVKCLFCYPNKPAYEFYNPENKELVCRYVIFQELEDFIRVEECSNKKTFDLFSKLN